MSSRNRSFNTNRRGDKEMGPGEEGPAVNVRRSLSISRRSSRSRSKWIKRMMNKRSCSEIRSNDRSKKALSGVGAEAAKRSRSISTQLGLKQKQKQKEEQEVKNRRRRSRRKERNGGRESTERGVEVNARNQQKEITERRRKIGQEEELECG